MRSNYWRNCHSNRNNLLTNSACRKPLANYNKSP